MTTKQAASKRRMTRCYCEGRPTFDPDFELLDGTGFECQGCEANVFWLDADEGVSWNE